jgi:hypothetical protein
VSEGELKTCPFCKEKIRQEAVKCRFCGEWLEPTAKPAVEIAATDTSGGLRAPLPEKAQPSPGKGAQQDGATQTRRVSPAVITSIGVGFLLATLALLFAAFGDFKVNAANQKQFEALTTLVLKIILLPAVVLAFALGRKGYRFLTFSTICMIAAGAVALYSYQQRRTKKESNRQFANTARAFAKDAQHYLEEGTDGKLPTITAGGTSKNEMLGQAMNDLFQEMGPPIANMNAELNALEMKDVFETSVLNSKANLAAEARKRIQSQEIIEKCRKDLPQAIEAFGRKAASYNVPDRQKKIIMDALGNARSNFLQQSQTMFNLLQRTEKSELDLLNFMNGSFAEYELKDGKLVFRNGTSRQKYDELAKGAVNAAKELEAFRKTMVEAQARNLERLER